ncbi:hypothetical protein [Paenarthrobacter sp. NEAU-H11]|uniref:hypothetical protein n=1 Tax=Paenarthrobacter sp. NEAU-H11 TaxID=3423924 RepID=UPI003D3307CE
MAGISGFDEFSKGLSDFVDNVSKLDGLTVSIDRSDTVAMVEDKIRLEARRRGVTGLSAAEVRSMAIDMHSEARR